MTPPTKPYYIITPPSYNMWEPPHRPWHHHLLPPTGRLLYIQPVHMAVIPRVDYPQSATSIIHQARPEHEAWYVRSGWPGTARAKPAVNMGNELTSWITTEPHFTVLHHTTDWPPQLQQTTSCKQHMTTTTVALHDKSGPAIYKINLQLISPEHVVNKYMQHSHTLWTYWAWLQHSI